AALHPWAIHLPQRFSPVHPLQVAVRWTIQGTNEFIMGRKMWIPGTTAEEEGTRQGKCPSGWHHYEGTASCYRVYLSGENYWDAVQTCQKVNASLATFTTDQELKFILQQEWDSEEKTFGRKDQRRTSLSENENILCAQFQCSHFPILRHHGFHSWYAENCYEKSSFLCKRSQTCVDIKDNIVDEGYNFTPKGDDPCLSCTCHNGEPEMCVAALCERPQGYGNSLFDSMASGMRLIVSCVSSFLILSLLLFMVHRLRQRRRERIESLIGANLHHFNLGRRMPGFDYGPDGFGTGLTPLHLSDDGEGGAFHFHDPPPPYTAYKYPDIQHPDDPPPPYEASINPENILCSPPGAADTSPPLPGESLPPSVGPPPMDLENSADSSPLLVLPDTPLSESTLAEGLPGNQHSHSSLNTIV
ncbi:putative DiGeorge syndrome critical region2 protein, partial [Naja naja]